MRTFHSLVYIWNLLIKPYFQITCRKRAANKHSRKIQRERELQTKEKKQYTFEVFDSYWIRTRSWWEMSRRTSVQMKSLTVACFFIVCNDMRCDVYDNFLKNLSNFQANTRKHIHKKKLLERRIKMKNCHTEKPLICLVKM